MLHTLSLQHGNIFIPPPNAHATNGRKQHFVAIGGKIAPKQAHITATFLEAKMLP